MKRILFFLLTLVSAAGAGLCLAGLVAPGLVPDVFPAAAYLGQAWYTVGLIAFLGLIVLFGTVYRAVKEKELFNEFGVRKKKARAKLSSFNRERVEAAHLAETEKIISQAELEKTVHKGSSDPEGDLEKMIGLPGVKEKVKALKARMDFDLTSRRVSSFGEMHHMIFYGPPGTGKTTVARIMAGLLYDYGYLDKNKTLEIDGNFLKGPTASATEKKVRIILSKAKGGVLFVDESYSLSQGGDAAGKQAIATLIKEMEDSRGKFVAIFAGYPKEMSSLLDANPGFRSRIKDYIFFPDYDESELEAIAALMAQEKGFSIEEEAFPVLSLRLALEKKEKSWGNARTVRSVIEESIDCHACNYGAGILPKSAKYRICACDVPKAPQKHI